MECLRKLRTAGHGGSRILLGVAMCSLLAQAVNGQAPASTHPMLAAFPEAMQMGPPQWVKPGTRVVTHMAAAAITYGKTSGASGQGFVVYNVLAIQGTQVALEVRNYVSLNGQLALGGITGQLSPGAVTDAWVHPALLQRALGMQGQGDVIAKRMPYPMNGKTFDAIRLEYRHRSPKDPTAYNQLSSYTYDARTGAALSSSMDVMSKWPGGMSQQRLVGIRQLRLPWAGAPAPGWLANVRVLRYRGTQTTTVPGAASITYPLTSDLVFGQRGADWAIVRNDVGISYGQGMPPQRSSSTRIVGTAQCGALWIAPAVLARLRQGQVIDNDPHTRIQTVVKYVGPSRAGRQLAVIAERTQAHEMEYGYDMQNGLMVFGSKTERAAMSRTRIEVHFTGQN